MKAIGNSLFNQEEQVVALPRVLVKMALAFEHEGKAHHGRRRTAANLLLKYYWEGVGDDVKEHVANCRVCQRRKYATLVARVPVVRISKVPIPWWEIHIDLIVELPETANGYKHILVVKDSLTKWVVMVPLRTKTAVEVAKAMVDEVYCKFGAAKKIYSDRGTEFHNQISKAINHTLLQYQQFTTAYHPQANGQVENQNRTIKDALATYVNKHHNDWDRFLPLIAHAYNTTVNEATGYSPFRALYGREAAQPTDSWMEAAMKETPKDMTEYVSRLQSVLMETWASGTEVIDRGHRRQEELEQRQQGRRIFRPLKEGESVFVKTIPKLHFVSDEQEKTYKLASKLQARYTGPHIITRTINPTTYMVRFDTGKEHAIHATKIKRNPGHVRKARRLDISMSRPTGEQEGEMFMEVDDEDVVVEMQEAARMQEQDGSAVLHNLFESEHAQGNSGETAIIVYQEPRVHWWDREEGEREVSLEEVPNPD